MRDVAGDDAIVEASMRDSLVHPGTAPTAREAFRFAPRTLLAVFVPITLFGVVIAYLFAIWPWMQHWGATAEERTATLPGDALVPGATDQSTRAVLIRAPADDVWRWVVQIGQDRGGFYSYDWLENLFGADIHNAERVRPEWQTLRAGDLVRAIPPGYLGGVLDETPGWRVAAIEPGRWFVLQGWGLFLVEPVTATTSRLVVRTRFRDETWWGPVVTRLGFGPVHFVMERRMLLGVRARAEGRSTSRAWETVAGTGFALAAAATALLLSRRQRAWAWLAAPALVASGVLLGTGDAAAAAAGFVALGLTLVGVPLLRRWWPVVLPVPVAVLLVLLLAPDAYAVFGVAFAALAMASGVVWLTRGWTGASASFGRRRRTISRVA
jgi:hypothetical protein